LSLSLRCSLTQAIAFEKMEFCTAAASCAAHTMRCVLVPCVAEIKK